MNFLSRLISSKPTGGQKLAELGTGEFSIVRSKDSPGGRRELLFANGDLSLISTTRQHCVQLLVREDDGKDELSGDTSDLEEDENVFLVHEDLRLGYFLRDGRVVVTWRDLDGEEGTRFEFLCSPTVAKDALRQFDHVACEAQYGQKYGKNPPSDAALEEFNFAYSENGVPQVESREPSDPQAAPTAAAGNHGEAPSKTEGDPEGDPQGHPLSEGRIMVQAECNLCVYDSVRKAFVSSPGFQQAEVVVLDQGNYEYFLEVRKSGKALLGTEVHEDLNQYIDLAQKVLIFNYTTETVIMSYLLQFSDQSTLSKVEMQLSVAQFEARNRKRFTDVSESHQDYLVDALQGTTLDTDMPDMSASDDDDDRDDYGVGDDSELNEAEREELGEEKNSALQVGHVNDRAYVLRGDKIGVFKNNERDVRYSTTIDNFGIADPKRIMLHEQDRALVIQAEKDPKTLYRMDLETGKIVDEWKTRGDVQDFNPVSKFAPTTAESTLFGVAQNSMFRIDPRVEGGKINERSTKRYSKSPTSFTNIVTTAAGYIVNGNSIGEIRLYDTLGNNAKTLIPGLGDPLIGLDVTADGRFVLATCARYLLLIETGTQTTNGFVQQWSKDTRPRPRKLQISPENIMFMRQQSGANIQFTPARFNTGVNAKEATIVTSTGPYLVTWSLSQVLRGEKDSYKIKKYTSNITAENFKFGTDQRVILTLEDDVNMVAKSALRSPDAVLRQD